MAMKTKVCSLRRHHSRHCFFGSGGEPTQERPPSSSNAWQTWKHPPWAQCARLARHAEYIRIGGI